METMLVNIMHGLVAFGVVVISLSVIRRVAVRLGWVHLPNPHKWQPKANPHHRAIAMGGGLGIYFGIALPLCLSPLLPNSPIFGDGSIRLGLMG